MKKEIVIVIKDGEIIVEERKIIIIRNGEMIQ